MKMQHSSITTRNLVDQAITAIAARWTRTLLTMLGVALGAGSFLAVIGLAGTAQARVNAHFDALAATTVTVDDRRPDEARLSPIDPKSLSRIASIGGATHAVFQWNVNMRGARVASGFSLDDDSLSSPRVIAAGADLPNALNVTLSEGRFFDVGHVNRADRVVVVGAGVARQLGITSLTTQPAVLIGTRTYSIIGILSGSQRAPNLIASIIMPTTTAEAQFGFPQAQDNPQFTVTTRIGAADAVASLAPLAASPAHPEWFPARAPYTASTLRTQVNQDLYNLFLALAVVCLLIGAVGIANTTLVAVMERVREIGLRRALGALRRHIVLQIISESALIGGLGGLVGMVAAEIIVLVVSALRGWTPVMSPALTATAPLTGLIIGILAGAYPAWQASRIEPTRALRGA